MAERTERLLQIGAGNIGRGLVGSLAHDAGMELTLADVDPDVIERINAEREYPVITVSEEGSDEQVVDGVRAVDVRDRDAFTAAVVEADVITTAVGPGVLPKLGPELGAALAERLRRRPGAEMHVTVIACENIADNTGRLREAVLGSVPKDVAGQLDRLVSFPDCTVDRIVPEYQASDAPLAVTVEDYFHWAVDANALKQPMPEIPGLVLSHDLESLQEQKLFTLNTAHALTAYFGERAGYEYVHEAIGDPLVRAQVAGAMQEIEPVITGRYEVITADDQQAYAERTLDRFANPHLRDRLRRVGRDPIRKLGRDDRLVRPAVLSLSAGETPAHLASGIHAALTHRNPDDPQAAELARRLADEPVESVLVDVSGLERGSPVVRMVRASVGLERLSA
ncbi:MAG: mannitol-1-phosphate 5-dehydrogenase [Patescibacteria group bacterium]